MKRSDVLTSDEDGLVVQGLEVRYGRVQALRGVSLHVAPGELVCLVGPNGAGKTTLMQSIAGLRTPVTGLVRFRGTEISGWAPERICRAGLSLVPEGRGTFQRLTVAENLRVAEAGRASMTGLEEAYTFAYELFPVLREFSGRAAGLLSGGQQQQLAIARALIGSPQFLLLDEPSIGLSPQVSADVFAALQILRDNGITVLIAEQRIRQVMAISDRTYVMNSGAIRMETRAASNLSEEEVTEAYFGRSEAGDDGQVVEE